MDLTQLNSTQVYGNMVAGWLKNTVNKNK